MLPKKVLLDAGWEVGGHRAVGWMCPPIPYFLLLWLLLWTPTDAKAPLYSIIYLKL